MSHKKDNNSLREKRHLDSLRWEIAKTLALEENAESEKAARESIRQSISRAERALSEASRKITEENLKDKSSGNQENQ